MGGKGQFPERLHLSESVKSFAKDRAMRAFLLSLLLTCPVLHAARPDGKALLRLVDPDTACLGHREEAGILASLEQDSVRREHVLYVEGLPAARRIEWALAKTGAADSSPFFRSRLQALEKGLGKPDRIEIDTVQSGVDALFLAHQANFRVLRRRWTWKRPEGVVCLTLLSDRYDKAAAMAMAANLRHIQQTSRPVPKREEVQKLNRSLKESDSLATSIVGNRLRIEAWAPLASTSLQKGMRRCMEDARCNLWNDSVWGFHGNGPGQGFGPQGAVRTVDFASSVAPDSWFEFKGKSTRQSLVLKSFVGDKFISSPHRVIEARLDSITQVESRFPLPDSTLPARRLQAWVRDSLELEEALHSLSGITAVERELLRIMIPTIRAFSLGQELQEAIRTRTLRMTCNFPSYEEPEPEQEPEAEPEPPPEDPDDPDYVP